MNQIQLTPQQVADARNALMALNRLIPQIQALEACGRSCQQLMSDVQSHVNQLQALLKHFGPGVE